MGIADDEKPDRHGLKRRLGLPQLVRAQNQTPTLREESKPAHGDLTRKDHDHDGELDPAEHREADKGCAYEELVRERVHQLAEVGHEPPGPGDVPVQGVSRHAKDEDCKRSIQVVIEKGHREEWNEGDTGKREGVGDVHRLSPAWLVINRVCEGCAVTTTETREKAEAKKGSLSDLPARIAVGVPAVAIIAGPILAGGLAFALLLALAGGLAAREGVRLLDGSKALALATALLTGGVVLAVAGWGREALPAAIAAAFGVLAVAHVVAGGTDRRVAPVLAGTICLVWVGAGLSHGVLLRELDHGGALVLLVLVGTFVGDTFAHLVGSVWGRTPLAPTISPRKTVEGLTAGVAGGTATVIALAVVAEPWLEVWQAAVLGFGVAAAAPLGDLWESAIKREAGVKDSGTLLGAHGGALDRIDALLFTVPLGYYLAIALL